MLVICRNVRELQIPVYTFYLRGKATNVWKGKRTSKNRQMAFRLFHLHDNVSFGGDRDG